MHKNLRSFIESLRRENEIVEVTTEVDADVVRVLTAISEFHPHVNSLKFATPD